MDATEIYKCVELGNLSGFLSKAEIISKKRENAMEFL